MIGYGREQQANSSSSSYAFRISLLAVLCSGCALVLVMSRSSASAALDRHEMPSQYERNVAFERGKPHGNALRGSSETMEEEAISPVAGSTLATFYTTLIAPSRNNGWMVTGELFWATRLGTRDERLTHRQCTLLFDMNSTSLNTIEIPMFLGIAVLRHVDTTSRKTPWRMQESDDFKILRKIKTSLSHIRND